MLYNFYPLGQESHVIARFYDKPVKTGEMNKNGLPKIRMETFVEIRIQNNSDIVDRVAQESDFARFPQEYAFYQKEKKQVENGTALTQFAFLDASQIETCKYRGIFTVEELAALEDDKAASIGLKEEKDLAEKFLSAQKNNELINDFSQKEKKYLQQIEQLKAEIQVLKGKIKDE